MKMALAKNDEDLKSLYGLSILSFLWSMASLMVFAVLPVFMKDELKISHTQIGFIEGIAISCAFLSKFFSGILSDLFRNRKPLIILGTLLNVLTKMCFSLAFNAWHIFLARFFDRLSKGLRSAPTDALIADISHKSNYAKNFGFRQSWCSFGGVVGAGIATLIMMFFNNDYRLLFGLALVPAILAIFVILKMINPAPSSHPRSSERFQNETIKIKDLKEFPLSFWWLLFGLFFLMMARFSEAFLVLKVKDVGISIAYLPLLTVLMDLVHSIVAFPIGKYADKISRFSMMINSLLLFLIADVILFYCETILGVTIGLMIIGVHMGISQGLMRALIAQVTPAHLRGTAFSLFFVISGFAILIGNSLAGHLSDQYGISYAFLGGGFFAFLSTLVFLSQRYLKALYANFLPRQS